MRHRSATLSSVRASGAPRQKCRPLPRPRCSDTSSRWMSNRSPPHYPGPRRLPRTIEGFGAGDFAAAADGVDDAFEVGEVGDAEAYEGVGVAGDGEALDEFGQRSDGVVDLVDLGSADEAQFGECFDFAAEFGVVEGGGVAGDDAGFLEAVDASFGGGGGEADTAPDFAGGAPAVVDEQGEDRVVGIVDICAWHGDSVTPKLRSDARIRCVIEESASNMVDRIPMTVVSPTRADLDTLRSVQDRVLWLATSIIHHANKVRETPSGVKVGGHQASSASMVAIMTALYFEHLRAPDRVSVKPHAAPVLHAINYLLGPARRAVPDRAARVRRAAELSRAGSRIPIPVDFSTGSVGIGATATIWSALAHRYVAGHFEVPQGGRQVALVGDAELDEGAIWEALVDPMVPQLGEVLWIVDLNRQSLDRVVPDIAAGRIGGDVRGGGVADDHRQVRPVAARAVRPRRAARRCGARIDGMPNEEYQRLLRCDAGRAARAAARRAGAGAATSAA